jgi:hypothetical protein
MIIGSGLLCAAALAIDAGLVKPIGPTLGGFVGLLAAISGVVFLGLIEGL